MRKIDPHKECLYCKKVMQRNRYNGRLEDMRIFLKRVYCDKICMSHGMLQREVKLAAYRKRAEKFKGKVCENCGTKEYLQIHHKDFNPANNEKINLETLCATCHMKWHWAHGKKSKSKVLGKCLCCDKPARRNNLCPTHESRRKRHGNPWTIKVRVKGGWELVGGNLNTQQLELLKLMTSPQKTKLRPDSSASATRKSHSVVQSRGQSLRKIWSFK